MDLNGNLYVYNIKVMSKIQDIFTLLKCIQQRPIMYLFWGKNLIGLLNFISWYSIWIWNSWYWDTLLKDKYFRFHEFIIEKTIWMQNRTDKVFLSHHCLLDFTNWNEEKAFDLFFKLLDEFIKVERIKLIPEIIEKKKKDLDTSNPL